MFNSHPQLRWKVLTRDSELTMVLVSRGDLKLSSGKLAAQCSHATAECILKAKKSMPRELDRYLREGARKIICKTENLQSMKEIYTKAKNAFEVAANTFFVETLKHCKKIRPNANWGFYGL